MYVGAKVTQLLITTEYKQQSVDIHHFLKKVQEFYVEAACQVKSRFPIGDPMIEMLEVLDPNITHSGKFQSLVPLAASFSNVIPESNLQQLDNEWRKLAIEELPFNKEDMEPDESERWSWRSTV